MNVEALIFGVVVSDEVNDEARLRIIAELAGLEHFHECILGLIFLRDDPNDHPEFLADAKKLGEMLEMELIKVGDDYHPDHIFRTGFDVLELADNLEAMNEEQDGALLDEDGPYPEFNLDVQKLVEHYEAEFAELAKKAFGAVNVKTEDELIDRYCEFRRLSHEMDGVDLPADDDEPDSDTVEERLTEDATSTTETLAYSATGKPAEEFA